MSFVRPILGVFIPFFFLFGWMFKDVEDDDGDYSLVFQLFFTILFGFAFVFCFAPSLLFL